MNNDNLEILYENLLNPKSVKNYLISIPTDPNLLKIIENIDEIVPRFLSNSYLYRGMSEIELNNIKRLGKATSKGVGVTRNIQESYVTDDIYLAGRFALVASYPENINKTRGGVITIIDRSKIHITKRDAREGMFQNYSTPEIPIDSLVAAIYVITGEVEHYIWPVKN